MPLSAARPDRDPDAVARAGVRHLVVVLGDQLDLAAPAFDGFDPALDRVWMAEVAEESTHVRSSKMRTAVFLSAMRHFAQALVEAGRPLTYRRLDAPDNRGSLGAELAAAIAEHGPVALVMTAPGEFRVERILRVAAERAGIPIAMREDRHFFASVAQFAQHARARKQVRLEYWYRELRRRHRILMDGDEPCGGQWNLDAENRASFGAEGPGPIAPPLRFAPDAITREVIALVRERFADHPGTVDDFGWPVTREQALLALRTFVAERLPRFGPTQDAMWTGEPWLWHSLLSVALNLRLLGPREVVAAAEAAYRDGSAPLQSVEGFVRQILGWREYVRGVYWTTMPGYAERNALGATESLPDFYWTGDTDMACLREAIGQTLRLGYAHHIQRLMVTGLYALLLGVEPAQVHHWYLGVYVDAVEWAELPNTLGMSQFADGGLMASKPYVASGRYIDRMSNHCAGCRHDPGDATGPDACPFTTLYWDFLSRHEQALAGNARMKMQLANLRRLPTEQRLRIAQRAEHVRAQVRRERRGQARDGAAG